MASRDPKNKPAAAGPAPPPNQQPSGAPAPVAIIGMSCRLPGGVSTPGEFYRMMCRGRSGWSKIPKDRFNQEAYNHPNPDHKGTFNSQGGYFIKQDLSGFDAAFFDVTRREAEAMDPAQRLLMECTYEALENGGIPREHIAGTRTGVFIGGNYGEHRGSHMRDLDTIPSFDATGNQPAFLSGRLAYYFNLHGPTFTVDTACSSSLHALHLAVQSIRNGESDAAVVGASHLITQPDIWVSMSMLRLFSDAGRTYAFDHRAKSGYSRGEGCAVIILKGVEQALKDNDHIFSVISHSGISHNGRTVGIVAPSPDEQEQLLRNVFTAAKIDPREVGFFEAHGTGTKKGDPIEATAIYNAVGQHFTKDDPLYIGSSKPNVGHLECASGLVSVIKGVLSLYYGFILPNADFDKENPEIPFQKWNMTVAKNQKPWPATKKYACVNNFGFSGSNSTCILAGPPIHREIELGEHGAYITPRLFVLSANDEQALRASIQELGIWLEQHAELYQTTMPRNLAYTLCQRRSHFPWRVTIVETICSGLAGSLNGHDLTPMRASSEQPRLAFIFTGQGAQWYAMGRELLQTHPVFLKAIKRADEALRKVGADFSIYEELTRDKETTKVGQAHISQPICSAVQLALVDLLDSFGIKPGAVTGHSSGEIGAAYAAGALTFEGAMEAAYYRGQMIVELKKAHPELKGSMLAVGSGAQDCEPLLQQINTSGSKAVVACENSPSSTTISGDEAAVDRVAELFQKKGTFNRKLFVDVAYHSPHMALIADNYLRAVSHIQPPDSRSSSTVEFYSSLHARRLSSLSELGPSYWVNNLTQPVRFSTALQHLISGFRPDILLEVGPHAALKGPIMQTIKYLSSPSRGTSPSTSKPSSGTPSPSAANIAATATKLTYLSVLDRSKSAAQSALEATGALFTRGYQGLNWFNINHNREEYERPDLVAGLYSYPWSRQSYWTESRIARQHRLKPFPRHDLLGVLADWSSDIEPTWRNVLSGRDLPWLKDYAVQGQGQRRRMVFPASGFVAMVVEAAGQLHLMRREGDVGPKEASKFEVKDLRVEEQLWLEDEEKEYEVLLTIRPGNDTGQPDSFRISSFEQSCGWHEHCTGFVKVDSASPVRRQPLGLSRPRAQSHSKTVTFGDDAVTSASSLDGQSDSAASSPKPASSSASDVDITTEADGSAAQAQGSTTPDTPPCSGHSASASASLDKRKLEQKLEHAKPTHPHNLELHSSETIYGHLASVGSQYPSDFKTLMEVHANENTAAANCVVRETKTEMPLEHETGYKIHPAVLDGLLQLPLLSLGAGGHDKSAGTSYLPAAIRHLSISSRLKKKPGQTFCTHSNVEDSSKGGEASFMIEAFASPGSETAAISIAGLQFESLEAQKEESGGPRELCFQVRWGELKAGNRPDADNRDDNKADIKEPKDEPTRNIAIITETPNPNTSPLIKAVYNQIEEQTGKQARISSIQKIADFSNSSFLVLSELDQPLVSSLANKNSAAEKQLDQIKKLLTTSPGLLWVTRGATRFPTSPNSNMALGLLRTARSEASAVAAALDLDPESRLSAEQQANLILQAFKLSVLSSSSAANDEKDAESAELEFAEEQGKLYVPRLEPDQRLNLEIARELGPSIPYTQSFHQDSPEELNGLRQLELAPSQGPKGELDNLHFEDRPEHVLRDDEVEILVAASAITLDDVDHIQQGASHHHRIARGCSGTVSRVGKGVHEVAVGANVCALAEGRFGTHARAKVTSVVPLSSSRITPEVGATIPVYVARAWRALVTLGHVHKGTKLMIQLSGPTSVAAVEIAKSLGADTWVYVTNDVEADTARKMGFAEERMLDERSIYLRRKFDKATGGTGFEVILTVSGGRNEGESKAWQCLADFGRLVEIRASGTQSSRPQLSANATFASIDMVSLAVGRPQEMQETLAAVMQKLEKGEFQPPTKTHVYKVPELSAALEWVRGGVTVYPVVVAAGGKDQVKATYRKSRGIFRRDGTHIIIGGTGGLGRSMAKYMAEHGARNIVLLSRSGGGREMVEQLEEEIACPDLNIRVKKCDASDERQVRELVKDCARELPSICGVIHAAMVLRDVLLESMSFPDFSQVIQPKFAGAWNVHNVLSDTGANLDYFVVLSSAAGILGSRGQGAYAAANTFLDSFVQYRVRNGLPGTSLDLTAVTDAGYLAENAERQEDIIRNFGNETVSEQEVLALLSAAVRGVSPPQVLTGLKLHLQSDGSWPYYASDARFTQLKADSLAAAEREGLVPKAAASPGNAFRAAKTDEEAIAIAGQGILQKLSDVLTIDVANLDATRNITGYGLDSLTAIELRNWIAKELRANLQILELLSSGTVNDLAAIIVQKTRAGT